MTFTVKSWNNANPQQFDDYALAVPTARLRAENEKAIVHLRDNTTEYVRSVHPDGTTGKWQNDSPYTDKDASENALDEIEDK